MIINHNLSALITANAIKRNDKATSSLLEKISSGLRINRAADDAAGLAISEKMRAQIRGLNQAVQNVQDGISLVQTAEGALAQSHEVLQRMRELAVQAASDNLRANHDRIDIETIDGNTGSTFVPPGGLHFNDGVLDNNDAVLMPQMIRTGAGTFAVVNHDVDFGTVATQANAVVYSERYGAGGFNHNAYAAYGHDTTYFFAQGGDPTDYLQSVQVWPQEDDNASLLFTVISPGVPSTVQVEGKGYNRNGTANWLKMLRFYN